uniref:Uncharacterized protein n=1 Tax=Arundo donax TaxID=35708 RepID=A0A0A9CSH6_ARUDO
MAPLHPQQSISSRQQLPGWSVLLPTYPSPIFLQQALSQELE